MQTLSMLPLMINLLMKATRQVSVMVIQDAALSTFSACIQCSFCEAPARKFTQCRLALKHVLLQLPLHPSVQEQPDHPVDADAEGQQVSSPLDQKCLLLYALVQRHLQGTQYDPSKTGTSAANEATCLHGAIWEAPVQKQDSSMHLQAVELILFSLISRSIEIRHVCQQS